MRIKGRITHIFTAAFFLAKTTFQNKQLMQKQILKEFKTLLSRGNALPLAVGVSIGGSFQEIVKSLVSNIVTPIIGLLGGVPTFSDIVLFGSIHIGNFMNSLISFLMAALVPLTLMKIMDETKDDDEDEKKVEVAK
jgi:large conductance mechanosensitive channel